LQNVTVGLMKNLICTEKELIEEPLGESKPASEMSIEELKAVIKVKKPVNTESKKKPSAMTAFLWYIVAILLGLIGGILDYVITKDDDPEMANNLLFVGVFITLLGLILVFSVF